MTSVAISELKASLSEYLTRVKSGEELMLTDHGVPVAKLVPMSPVDDQDAALTQLIRAGIARPPVKKLSPQFLEKLPRVEVAEGRIRAALAEERDTGW